MVEFARFGDPARFEIAVRWARDTEPRSRRPAGFGWSMGDLRVTVAGMAITRSQRNAASQDHVGWYLAPFFEWLATHWAHILHEQAFAWAEKRDAPAVAACRRALALGIEASDDEGRKKYREVQAWFGRHALRAVSEGGLFPDVFVRRLGDEIELSWSSSQPLFAPDGFRFVLDPGHALLPVRDVAGPLWEALQWCASQPPPSLHGADIPEWRALYEKIEAVRNSSSQDFDRVLVAPGLLKEVRDALKLAGRPELAEERTDSDAPYVDVFAPAVAMFGGVSPNLTRQDVGDLCGLLAQMARGGDSEAMAKLVREGGLGVPNVPHAEGYQLAEILLEDLDLARSTDWIDIRSVVAHLGIEIVERRLQSAAIRGVALAGEGFTPTILVNAASIFNANENGQRFTIAHELCHILFDRNRARRVAHISGQWVAPGIERRANAFAAYALMPRHLVVRLFSDRSAEGERVVRLARTLHVNESALIEHLYNLDLIDEVERERLRTSFRSS